MISLRFEPLVSHVVRWLVAPTGNRLAAAALLALGLFTSSAAAAVTLPNVFSDHMVLQRKQANKVWGKAAPGEKVVVTIGGQSHEATAAADGAWEVKLEPMEAGEPLKLTAKGQANEVSCSDVLVGEVWVCSGQSNMAYALNQADGGNVEAPLADHPQIRLLTIPSRGSQTHIWTQPNARWVVCTPQSARNFSAVGYYFARQIQEALNVPVGIINNAWSGSRAEAWVDRKYFDGHEHLLPIVARYDGFAKELAELEAKGQLTAAERTKAGTLRTDVNGDDRPANAWNGIVASHAGFGIRGVLWYQGGRQHAAGVSVSGAVSGADRELAQGMGTG